MQQSNSITNTEREMNERQRKICRKDSPHLNWLDCNKCPVILNSIAMLMTEALARFFFLLALSPYFTQMDMRLLGWFLFLLVTFALLNSWCSSAIAADIDVFGIFAEQSRWKYFMHNVNNGFQQFRMTISNLCTYLFNSIRCKLYVVSLVENCSTIHSEDSGGWEEMSHITNSVSFAVPVGCILTTFTGYKHTVRYTTYEIHLSLRCRSQFQICQRQLATRQFSLMSTA